MQTATQSLLRHGRVAFGAIALSVLAMATTSCDSEEKRASSQFDPAAYKIEWNANNLWNQYNQNTPLTLNPFTFSHTTEAVNGETDWFGFVASRQVDPERYTDWKGHETALCARTLLGGAYLVAHFNPAEKLNSIPATPSVSIRMTDNSRFELSDIYFANTTYGMYTMRYSNPEDGGISGQQWCRVNVIGVRDGVEVIRKEVYLAKNNEVLGDMNVAMNSLGASGWQKAHFDKFEDLDYVYMQMEASTTGDGELKVAPYFVVGPVIYTKATDLPK